MDNTDYPWKSHSCAENNNIPTEQESATVQELTDAGGSIFLMMPTVQI